MAIMAIGAAGPASAALVDVTGPNSSLGTGPAIIAAPADVRDDAATNTGMQGFDERQGLWLNSLLNVDGGSIGPGIRVDSHMIFLNTAGNQYASHREVKWEFSGAILGVMSNSNGSLEVASSSFLGALGTIYPNSPFNARGLEGTGIDGYSYAGNFLTVSMEVTEPGDWIRVVTVSEVPVPAALPLLAGALAGFGFFTRRRRDKT
ncbi:MAG: hypothetical protein ACU0DK_13205 [Pseudooceanicola sp.]